MELSKKLLIIQEILPSYRIPVFNKIAQISGGDVTVFAASGGSDYGSELGANFTFSFEMASWLKFLGVFKSDFSVYKLWRRNDVLLHVADFKFVSLWLLLLLSYFSSKKMFIHGQGGYKQSGFFVNLIYSAVVFLSDGYICYTEYSKLSLKRKIPDFLHKKLSVCDNTLEIDSVEDVLDTGVEPAIFYVGRLRQGCGIENLLRAAMKEKVHVKVIGTGGAEYMQSLRAEFSTIATFYGAVFDEQRQMEISRTCLAGVYGGDAGLSVVHYMALGLPVIVHGDIDKHMGPEPSYVIDGVNGLIFKRGDVDSLSEKIALLKGDDKLRYSLASAALATFNQMSTPSMGEKFSRIMGLIE